MASEEVKTLFAVPEVDHAGLLRMKVQTEVTQYGGRPLLGFFSLFLG
jgi:hypothetical protein